MGLLEAIRRAVLGRPGPAAPLKAASDPGRPAIPPSVSSPARQPSPSQVNQGYIDTTARSRSVVSLPATGRGYFLEVRGEMSYQDALQEQWFAIRPERELSVQLTAEPSNPYDSNAVVVQTSAGKTIGYLSREDAPRFQQLILQLEAQGQVCTCSGAWSAALRIRRRSASVWMWSQLP